MSRVRTIGVGIYNFIPQMFWLWAVASICTAPFTGAVFAVIRDYSFSEYISETIGMAIFSPILVLGIGVVFGIAMWIYSWIADRKSR